VLLYLLLVNIPYKIFCQDKKTLLYLINLLSSFGQEVKVLKRYQVLIDDWMEDYIKLIAEKYGISASAAIRVHLGISILYVIPALFPGYKPNLANTELRELSKNASKGEFEEAESHQMLSKILFEARKAVEFRLSKEKKLKKK